MVSKEKTACVYALIPAMSVMQAIPLVTDYEGVLKQFDDILGLDQVAVIHVNDSLNPCGAHKDRHANIGQGTIGFDTPA